MKATNIELWNALRGKFPTFKSHTSEATADFFNERGFKEITAAGKNVLDEWYELSLRTYLLYVDRSRVNDPLENGGFGETYDAPFGGIVQKLAVNPLKPVSPKFKGLANGKGPDPFIVRKADTEQRFWKQNFDYSNFVTIPDEYVMKQIFISEYGMDDFVSEVMNRLEQGYTVQKYMNKLEALNAAINDTLKDTQKITWSLNTTSADLDEYEPTAEELESLVLSLKNLITAFKITPTTGAFNKNGYDTAQDIERLKLILRPGIANALTTKVLASTYHDEKLSLPIDFIEVENFGGLIPKYNGNTVYPAYDDETGEQIGWSATEGGDPIAEFDDTNFTYEDPNKNVVGIVADRGLIFECRQNEYRTEPIRNPRGLYTNIWVNSPGNTVAADMQYNMIVIEKTASQA